MSTALGKLAHTCRIVMVGQIFLHRFIDYSMKAKHGVHLSLHFQAVSHGGRDSCRLGTIEE